MQANPHESRKRPVFSTAIPRWCLPALELANVFGLVVFDIWVLRGRDQPIVHLLLFATVLAVMAFSHERRRGDSLNRPIVPAPAARAWTDSLIGTTTLSMLILAACWSIRDVGEPFVLRYEPLDAAGRAWWMGHRLTAALAQQFAVQFFLLPVCSELVGGRWGIGLAAVVFATVHLPHPALVAASLIAGAVWMWLYSRGRRLAPLVVSHVAIATLACGLLPNAVIIDLTVGAAALEDLQKCRFLARAEIRQIERVVTSREYYASCDDDSTAFVTELYHDLMHRAPEPAELKKRTRQLTFFTRAEVARRILASNEFQRLHATRTAREHLADDLIRTSSRDISDSPPR